MARRKKGDVMATSSLDVERHTVDAALMVRLDLTVRGALECDGFRVQDCFVFLEVPADADVEDVHATVELLRTHGARAVKVRRAPRSALLPAKLVDRKAVTALHVGDAAAAMLRIAVVDEDVREAARAIVDDALGRAGL